MIKSFKLFEELKRKAPANFEIGDTFMPFDPEKGKSFGLAEKKLLEDEGFVIINKSATCEDTYCDFEIIKTCPDEFSEIYELIIKDKQGNTTHSRKFKSDIYNRTKYLDVILNICARYHEDLERKVHADVDPYGEEVWDTPEKVKKPERDPVEAAYGEEDWDVEDDMVEPIPAPDVRDAGRARMAHRHIPPADVIAMLQRDQERRVREFERGREANIEALHRRNFEEEQARRHNPPPEKPKKKGFYKTIEDFLKKSGPPSMHRRG